MAHLLSDEMLRRLAENALKNGRSIGDITTPIVPRDKVLAELVLRHLDLCEKVEALLEVFEGVDPMTLDRMVRNAVRRNRNGGTLR